MPVVTRKILASALLAAVAAGCGSSSSSTSAGPARTAAHRAPARAPQPVVLRAAPAGSLPEPRSGGAAAAYGGSIVFSGGLSSADASTDTVFRVAFAGGTAARLARLPSPVHDAAATTLSGRLLVLGGGQSEGSDRIVQVIPGPPHLIGSLPQPLSDLVAVASGGTAYVVGGWNGSATNQDVYAVDSTGKAHVVAKLPLGVRYPAAASLGGRVIVAGGETVSGTPTSDAWSLNPATGSAEALPALPVPTDHAAGAVLGGRFYLIGGLRRGELTGAILSWAPGEARWRASGHLPQAIADLSAVASAGAIAVLGGRNSAGRISTVTLLRPA